VVIATGSAFTKLEENGELATKAPSQLLHQTIHRHGAQITPRVAHFLINF